MPKVTKKNVNRQNEFIEAAQALFNEKGFENTSVDDIVGRMGVAKGLFYYYFESKDALLKVILERLIDEIESSVTAVMEKKGLTALQRFQGLLAAGADVGSRCKTLVDYFHQEKNRTIHFSIEERSWAFMVPIMEKIIEQGNSEGVFHAEHPRMTAIALVALMAAARRADPSHHTVEGLASQITALQDIAERILVMEPGTFRIIQELIPMELMSR